MAEGGGKTSNLQFTISESYTFYRPLITLLEYKRTLPQKQGVVYDNYIGERVPYIITSSQIIYLVFFSPCSSFSLRKSWFNSRLYHLYANNLSFTFVNQHKKQFLRNNIHAFMSILYVP